MADHYNHLKKLKKLQCLGYTPDKSLDMKFGHQYFLSFSLVSTTNIYYFITHEYSISSPRQWKHRIYEKYSNFYGIIEIFYLSWEVLTRRYSFSFFLFFFFFCFLVAYGSSQTRSQIRVAAASLYHNHSNIGSELHLWRTPQLTATPDP